MGELKTYLEARGLRLKKKTAKEWSSPCPWCGGTDRFCVFDDEDRYWCRRCGKFGDYIQALIDLEGLSFREASNRAKKAAAPDRHGIIKGPHKTPIIKHPEKGTPDILYTYTDAIGTPAYYVARWNARGDHRKSFCIVSKDGHQFGAAGIKQILYNLHGLARSKIVYFVEGEKAAEAVISSGLAGTTTPGGTGNLSHLVEDFDILEPLKGKLVYIVPDQDAPGKKYANTLAKFLAARRIPCKIVFLPANDEPGYDVADYYEEYGPAATRTLLLERGKNAKPYTRPRQSITLGELLAKPFQLQQDIVRHILPQGGHLLIAGEAGVGKSLLRTELALHIAYGKDFLTWNVPTPRRVCILQFENTEQMEQRRVAAMLNGLDIKQATPNLEFAENSRRWDLTVKEDRAELYEFVQELETEVMIYDCLSNMHSASENDNIQMRHVLDTISRINSRLNISSILIHHFGKPQQHVAASDDEEKYRVRGASSLMDWAVTALTYTAWARPDVDMEIRRDFRRIKVVKVRDAPPQKALYCERSRENYLLTQVESWSDLIRDWVIDHGGEFTEGRARFKEAMAIYFNCGRYTAAKHIDMAVEDGYLEALSVPGQNKIIYAARQGEDIPGHEEKKQQQGIFDWAQEEGEKWQ